METKKKDKLKKWFWIFVATFDISMIIVSLFVNCAVFPCIGTKVKNGRYCKAHTCRVEGCRSRYVYSWYCPTHEYENRRRISEQTKKNEENARYFEIMREREKNNADRKGNNSRNNSGASGTKYYGSSSYDVGYDSIAEGDDYDENRYNSDSDYADGVDDAMDDEGW